MKNKSLKILLLLLSLTLLLVSGCDDRDFVTSPDAAAQGTYTLHSLTTSEDVIYSDDNVTFSYIEAKVYNGNNYGVPGITVYFKSDMGKIVAQTQTDNSGIARVPFYDDGCTPGTATITALVYTYSALDETEIVDRSSKEITVKIEDKPAVASIELIMSSTDFFVNQTMQLRARVEDEFGNAVPDSTLVKFQAIDRGYFLDSENEDTNIGTVKLVPTQNGNATLTLNVGPQTGEGKAVVSIGELSAEKVFTITHGNPTRLELASFVEIDGVNVPGDESSVSDTNPIIIEASLKDAYNNPCDNKIIRFETDLGTFNNTEAISSVNTDEDGISKAIFTPGLSAGPAKIKAFANGDTLSKEILFTVKSSELHSIRFAQDDAVSIAVANTGGQETAILTVDLYDINGNLVDQPQTIYFKLMSNQSGDPDDIVASLSTQDADGIVTTTSNGGHATVSVVSGTISGPLTIRAATDPTLLDEDPTNDDADAKSATKSNVIITSGPANYVTLQMGAFGQGSAVGTHWEYIISAQIKDKYMNPVQHNTAVMFSLADDNNDVMIQGNAYVGNGPTVGEQSASNTNIDSLSSVGIAFTLLTYGSQYTFTDQTIQVKVYTSEDDQNDVVANDGTIINITDGLLTASKTINLSLNEPDADFIVTPASIVFDGEDEQFQLSDYKYAMCKINLQDGLGVNINGAQFEFTADKGNFVSSNTGNATDITDTTVAPPLTIPAVVSTNRAVTGEQIYYLNNEEEVNLTYTNGTDELISYQEDGFAVIFLKIKRGHGNPSPDGFVAGQQPVSIIARLLGTGIVERQNTMILRYPYSLNK